MCVCVFACLTFVCGVSPRNFSEVYMICFHRGSEEQVAKFQKKADRLKSEIDALKVSYMNIKSFTLIPHICRHIVIV